MKPIFEDLEIIEVVNGLNDKLEGFVQINASSVVQKGTEVKTVLIGQVDPDTLRRMAMQFLEVAEAAEHDAMVARSLIQEYRIDEQAALAFIATLRHQREQPRADE